MPMKEQVADTSKVLQDITAEMRLMHETINQQYAEIANLNRNIETLNRQIRKKDETIAKRNAQPAIEKIKEYIMSSSVVGFDESGCYCNKRLDWAWIAQTVYYTLLFRADGRSSKVLTDKFCDSLERLDNLLKLNICNFGKKFETFKKGLIKCRDYIFNFLEDPMIPSDNNGSERGIRKLKIKLKNSCTFRSDLGTDAFL